MEITAQDFRDNIISEISICYDWDTEENVAIIKIKCYDKSIETYRINGLVAFNIYEDFNARYIEQCLLINKQSSVYLSLDPYSEIQAEIEKDNYYFSGCSIEKL